MKIHERPEQKFMTLPNLLSAFRLVVAPILLWLAWHGYDDLFLILLAAGFFSDALDGITARLTGQVTEFGAMLDSWADVITYLTIAVSTWWLWPDVVNREIVYVALVIASYLLPAVVGIVKFGSFTSYHTWTVKFAAAAMAFSLYTLFLGGPAWPFRTASFICALAAFEEMAITLLLTQKQSNISSLWSVIRHIYSARSRSNQ
ncbi:CDP-alcohol phosphatidyltransferase [Candidatus Methylobacter favarea]|uniref:CDP-alcohol phosphatidyltransferase n=1 Tax=Candidatus Methylobacter favarea TaxID=2707345 RepID=A0A8S0WJE4_9GAMM|nr:CDP-alcohol phosphatidyltransferase family protein [Candidatus Methylobacter favarea]CAA9891254.1 CDP-alcohol phosphatidyltransferase [Candidatus Methylobacter favarea]